MTTFMIGALVYRLAGLLVVTRAVPTLVDLLVQASDQPGLLIGHFLVVALGVLLWVNASWLAERTLPKPSEGEGIVAPHPWRFFEVGIRLIGLWLIAARGIPNLLSTVVHSTFIGTQFGSLQLFSWWHLVPSIIEIAIGLWLLIAPGRIGSLLQKGRAPQSEA